MSARGAKSNLLRFITLLRSLPAGPPGRSTAELREALEVAGHPLHLRSLQRDLAALAAALPIRCDTTTVPYRWFWASGQSGGMGALSTPEALLLALAEQHLNRALPAHMMPAFESLFERARSHLTRLGPNSKTPRWVDKIRAVSPVLPATPPKVDALVHAAVAEALMNERQLEVEYHSGGRKRPLTLILNPLALILRGPALYLVATAKGHGDVRLFAMQRIRKAVELTAAAARPRGFDIDESIAAGLGQFGTTPDAPEFITLELRCEDWLARQLEEAPIAPDQKVEWMPDGTARVRATAAKTWQLQWWVMSVLHGATVTRPLAYRRQITELLSAAYDRHTET
jgi:predicted DNA-binding transcriptional regulator YafY